VLGEECNSSLLRAWRLCLHLRSKKLHAVSSHFTTFRLWAAPPFVSFLQPNLRSRRCHG